MADPKPDTDDLKTALDGAAIVPPDPSDADDQGDIAADDAGATALLHRLEAAGVHDPSDVGGG